MSWSVGGGECWKFASSVFESPAYMFIPYFMASSSIVGIVVKVVKTLLLDVVVDVG